MHFIFGRRLVLLGLWDDLFSLFAGGFLFAFGGFPFFTHVHGEVVDDGNSVTLFFKFPFAFVNVSHFFDRFSHNPYFFGFNVVVLLVGLKVVVTKDWSGDVRVENLYVGRC